VRLLKAIRQRELNSEKFPSKVIGEENSSTRENLKKVFLSDPYHLENFKSALTDDIQVITGTHLLEGRRNRWSQMPRVLIIPFLSGLHWRCVRVEIDYINLEASVLWDDPYGVELNFEVRRKLLNIIKINVVSLINIQKKLENPDEHDLIISIVMIEDYKKIDQQGRGRNGWDCGPIVFSNATDYLDSGVENEQFAEENPPYRISKINCPRHEEQLVSVRVADIIKYRKIACSYDETNLKLTYRKVRQKVTSNKKGESNFLVRLLPESSMRRQSLIQKSISDLPALLISKIFECVENSRLITGENVGESYTTKELQIAYESVLRDQKRRDGSLDKPTKIKRRESQVEEEGEDTDLDSDNEESEEEDINLQIQNLKVKKRTALKNEQLDEAIKHQKQIIYLCDYKVNHQNEIHEKSNLQRAKKHLEKLLLIRNHKSLILRIESLITDNIAFKTLWRDDWSQTLFKGLANWTIQYDQILKNLLKNYAVNQPDEIQPLANLSNLITKLKKIRLEKLIILAAETLKQEGNFIQATSFLQKKTKQLNFQENKKIEKKQEELQYLKDSIEREFENSLTKIASKIQKKPSCFICYKWEDHVNSWVRKKFVPHLVKGGIDVWLDVRDITTGLNILGHALKIEKANFACFIGTPEFKKAIMEIGLTDTQKIFGVGAAFEMKIIYERRADGTVLPILLEGKSEDSIPPGFRLTAYQNYSKIPEDYYGNILRLVSRMLGDQAIGSRKLMNNFNKFIKKACTSQLEEEKRKEVNQNMGSWKNQRNIEKREIEKKTKKIHKQKGQRFVNWEEPSKTIPELQSFQKLLKGVESIKENTILIIKKLNELGEFKKVEVIIPKYFNIPKKNRKFTGRDLCFTRIKEKLDSGVDSVITQSQEVVSVGLGGIGKSSLALEFVHRNAQDYKFVFWFNASERSHLDIGFRSLAVRIFGAGRIEGLKPNDIREMVLGLLEKGENQDWLIVYDDVSDERLLEEYRPKLGRHVLITSRREDLWDRDKIIRMNVFERSESIGFLGIFPERFFDEISEDCKFDFGDEWKDELAELLGDFPLALTQARAYVERMKGKVSYKRYVEIFKTDHLKQWRRERIPKDYNMRVARTWLISMKQIECEEKKRGLSGGLLRFISFLDSTNVPLFLLESFVRKENPDIDNGDFLEILEILESFCMIESYKEFVNVHKLVQQVIRDKIEGKKSKVFMEKIVDIVFEEWDFAVYKFSSL
jgi:hypothetical protein